jgi:hypothetical protein
VNDEQLTGALVAMAVVILSAAASALLALIVNHSDKIRHDSDQRAADARHATLTAEIKKRDELINTLIRSHGRHDTGLIDHQEVLTDHAEKLDALLPGQRSARPRPLL